MELSKVSKNGQVTIPKPLRDEMDIQVGDYVEIIRTEDGILLRPKKIKIYDPISGDYSSL
jgi:AbrB family looped-hinge helix DNA binding protein